MPLMNLKLTKLNKIDIFSPYLLLVLTFLYFILAYLAFYYQIRGISSPSLNLYLYILFASLFYLLGILTPFILHNIGPDKFNYSQYQQILSNSGKEFKYNLKFSLEKILMLLVLFGLFLQLGNLYASGGIPLLSGYLKATAVTKVWLISYILFLPAINVLLANYTNKKYYILLVLGILLFALTGYRTTTMAILLSAFITLYYTRRFKVAHIMLFVFSLIILVLVVGYVAVQSIEWQQWTLNPFELFLYRSGYTLTVFDQLIPLQGSTQGSIFYYTLTGYFESMDPRIIIGEAVLGYRHSSTSTIWGPALLDFGKLGLALQMFSLGLILKLMHFLQTYKKGVFTAFYAIIFAQTLIWIETGPTDLVVWIFYIMALALIISTLYQLKKVNPTKNDLYSQ